MVSITPRHLDALARNAERGIDCDGLTVECEDGLYRFIAGTIEASELTEGELRRIAEDAGAYVTNWYYWSEVVDATPAGEAFLRWLERAMASSAPPTAGVDGDARTSETAETERWSVPRRYDELTGGIARTWGQLRVTTRSDEVGRRRYHLCHVDDVTDSDPQTGALQELEGPRELADRITHDDRGRYRPLRSAPTLPTGWCLSNLEWDDLLTAVAEVYPASIENWHREREGRLDVDHFRATAERQTGIYDVVEDLPREALEWVAQACCVDSQCLKRREWDEAPDDELSVPRGEGEFPCREPCSLLLAAARKWTLLEREEPRTYELELTPSEKEQLEEIVDAVADDRITDIREADLDDGANRFRARYLRAKRFEDGERPE